MPLGPDSNTSESTGTITAVATEPSNLADRNVQASEDNPRYEVRLADQCTPFCIADRCLQIENTNTGKKTAIYEANILGKA